MLTQGAVLKMFNSESVQSPVLQVIEIGGTTSGDKERFRLLLSDGIHFVTSMVTSGLNPLCKDGHLTNNSIIRITEYLLHTQGPRKIIIILQVEVVQSGSHKIGNPQSVEQVGNSSASNVNVPPPTYGQKPPNTISNAPVGRPPSHFNNTNNFTEKKNSLAPNSIINQQPKVPPPVQVPPAQTNLQQRGGFTAKGRGPQIGSQPVPAAKPPPPQNQAVPMSSLPPSGNRFQNSVGRGGGGFGSQSAPKRGASQQPSSQSSQSSDGQPTIYPITSLTPYLKQWAIKCRVAFKSPIKNYNNQKGEGRLFNVELVDSSGDINCTIFNDSVDHFLPLLEVGSVYIISRGTIKQKASGPKYTSSTNRYEMTLSGGSIAVPCTDDTSDIPQGHYAFHSLAEVSSLPEGEVIDVIGLVTKVGDIAEISTKKDPTVPLLKRMITLMDDTGYAIDLTLFGDQATDWNNDGNVVVAIKNVKISDFSGRSLTAQKGNTRWEFEPNHPRTHQLHNWVQSSEGLDVQTLSRSAGGGASGSAPYKTLKEAQEEARGGKTVFFSTHATIVMIKHDESAALYYTSCPQNGCNKKVVQEEETKMWYCSKCHKSYPDFSARYVLFVKISDDSLSEFATIFNEPAAELLQKDANEIRKMRDTDSNDPEFIFSFENALQKRFLFKIKAVEEAYQDELKVKFTILSMEPIDYLAQSKNLIEKIGVALNMK